MINLPTRTPTSFIYLAAAGIAAYFSDEVTPLRWLAYSAAMMFVVRGPLGYFQDCLDALYENAGRDFRALLQAGAVLVLIEEWVLLRTCWLLGMSVCHCHLEEKQWPGLMEEGLTVGDQHEVRAQTIERRRQHNRALRELCAPAIRSITLGAQSVPFLLVANTAQRIERTSLRPVA